MSISLYSLNQLVKIPVSQVGDGCVWLGGAGGVATGTSRRVRVAQETVGGGTNLWLAQLVPQAEQ